MGETSKSLVIELNNDTDHEAEETISVVISDETGTAQIVNERASVSVRDDDPSRRNHLRQN